ncbi:hypothetical protein [Bacillus velezensis]|uniref:hypothetical protein n=1 Tax=Bacillus velezensis TaxID=492670 RepID=UPI0018E74F28|nr:hypothetical protein [Bacillus velezensis]
MTDEEAAAEDDLVAFLTELMALLFKEIEMLRDGLDTRPRLKNLIPFLNPQALHLHDVSAMYWQLKEAWSALCFFTSHFRSLPC